jgi:hypothetical protein
MTAIPQASINDQTKGLRPSIEKSKALVALLIKLAGELDTIGVD